MSRLEIAIIAALVVVMFASFAAAIGFHLSNSRAEFEARMRAQRAAYEASPNLAVLKKGEWACTETVTQPLVVGKAIAAYSRCVEYRPAQPDHHGGG